MESFALAVCAVADQTNAVFPSVPSFPLPVKDSVAAKRDCRVSAGAAADGGVDSNSRNFIVDMYLAAPVPLNEEEEVNKNECTGT